MRSRCPCRLLFFVCCLALALGQCAPPLLAQNVRWHSTSYASVRRQADTAAEKQGRADWPRIIDGEPGTQVHVSFDLRNADVTLMTPASFGQQRLLAEAQRIAPQIGCPRADFILFTGTKTDTTDIELNKYLARPDRRHTSFDLSLSALAHALNASALPRPIVLSVRGDAADTALLAATAPTQARRLGDAAFFALSEVPPDAHLRFAASIPWYAPLVAYGFLAMLLLGLVLAVLLPWRQARRRDALARQGLLDAPPSPEEVQRRYDRQKPWRLVSSVLPLLFVLLTFLGHPHHLITSIIYSLPFELKPQTMIVFPVLVGGLFALSMLSRTVVERLRARRTGMPLPTLPADPDAPPAWTTRWFVGVMAVMMVPMLVLPFTLFNGTILRLPWLRFVPYSMIGLMAVALSIGGWLTLRATRTNLPPDDFWHVMVDEVAAQAGVRVRHVVRVQSPTVNAFASLFGTVGLTAGLLRKMEPDEVRVVIAHEIGHLHGGHVRRGFVLSVLALAVYWAVRWYGLHAARGHLSDAAYIVLSGPMISIFVLPFVLNLLLGRGRRLREAAADRFAVQATQNPELVIATLTKLHTLNASPHRLRPSDEIFSSHPSLTHRIEAIRSHAAAHAASE